MLGCFKPDFPSLTEEEKNIYKALHCSMCKSLQKNYGNLPTLFLNYDLDFIFNLRKEIAYVSFKKLCYGLFDSTKASEMKKHISIMQDVLSGGKL